MGKKLAAEDPNDKHSENTPTLVEHSVDELAKGLATGTLSRRKALRMLGAALVGGVLASIPGVAWAQPQRPAGPCRPGCPEGYTCTRSPRDGTIGTRGNPFWCCPADPQEFCCLPEDFCASGECCGAGQCTPNGECCVGEIMQNWECCEGAVMPNGECCEGHVMFNGECCPSPMNYCSQVTCDASGNCVSCEVCCPADVQCVHPGTETGCPITCAS
jgi:hypothetical protein